MRVWINKFHKLYPIFIFLRKMKLIKIIPCDSWKTWTITK